MNGALQVLLNGGPPSHTATRLLEAYAKAGWPALQFGLLYKAPDVERDVKEQWRNAMAESIVFAGAGFVLMWCTHKEHWYISDDKRRKDCPRHRLAGQQKRWRERNKAKERSQAAAQTRQETSARRGRRSRLA